MATATLADFTTTTEPPSPFPRCRATWFHGPVPSRCQNEAGYWVTTPEREDTVALCACCLDYLVQVVKAPITARPFDRTPVDVEWLLSEQDEGDDDPQYDAMQADGRESDHFEASFDGR